jgi:putative ABC transport system permease protein
VRSEFSYDKFHKNSERLYRIWIQDRSQENNEFISTITSLPLGPSLKTDIPQIESYCRVYKFNTLVRAEGASFDEKVHMVDSHFFDMFNFTVLRGNTESPFLNKNSIVITERIAKKYFGTENGIGKNIELLIDDKKTLFTVDGIIKESPVESSIIYDFLISFENEDLLFNERMRTSQFNIFVETYVLLKDKNDLTHINKTTPAWVENRLGEKYGGDVLRINFQPITDIHLNNFLPTGIEPISNPKYSYILLTIGMLIIVVACINYIILSVSLSTKRSLEVGIRKVLGANSPQLVRQFFGESFVLTVVSMVLGFILMFIFYKPFIYLVGKELDVQFDLRLILFCTILCGLIGLLSGLYPAVLISRHNILLAIKGKIRFANSRSFFRKGLIGLQFVLSIGLIICAVGVDSQLNYLKEKDLGFNRENIIVVPTNLKAEEGLDLARLYMNNIKSLPEVGGMSIVMYSLAESPWASMGYFDNTNTYRDFQFNSVDNEFLKVMNIEVVQGSDFTSQADSGLIVNETLAKEYGWADPIGKTLPGPFNYRIVGVVKDFNIESLHTKIKPLLLATNFDAIARISETMMIRHPLKPKVCIRLRKGQVSEQIKTLRNKWHEIASGNDFQYSFLDETIQKQYEEDERTSKMVKLASLLAIFIACSGLYGIVAVSVASKTKEIAIRKVLGASAVRIIMMISKEYLVLILIASIFSIPLAWIFMNNWLSDFEYRVNLKYYLFFIAAAFIFGLAFLTIFVQAFRTAVSNPAERMKSE